MARPRKRWILLSFGILLLLIAVAGSFYWFYWLGPVRSYTREFWRGDRLGHFEEWRKTKARIRRTGWVHDDCVTVGLFGDKEFAAETIERMRRGQLIAACWEGHKDEALSIITNQDAGHTVEEWQEWWKRNKDHTQEEWIQEGFQKAGITLHSPLTKEDIKALLYVIGKTEERRGYEYPRHLRFNAVRWLRDSDFDPDTFSTSDLSGEDAETLLDGLVWYSEWVGRYQRPWTPGVLWPEKLYQPAGSGPFVIQAWFVGAVYLVLAILFGGGILFIRAARRNRVRAGGFQRVWRKTVPWSLRRKATPELPAFIEPLYEQLTRSPADLESIREHLIQLLSFLAMPENRTDANCRATDIFFAIRDYWEEKRVSLPPAFEEVLDDVGGCLHDTISAPQVAKNFESTPEQLLARARQLRVE